MTNHHHPMARRIGLGIAAITVLITTTSGMAYAQGSNHRFPLNNKPADIPADVCGFPIHIGVVDDREYSVQQTDNPDGSTTMRVGGTLINSLTNMDTGATINYDNGGPGEFTFYTDGHFTLDFQGHSMEWIRPEHQAQLGAPAFRLTTGHAVGATDTSGDIVDLSVTGKIIDGCALLS